MSEETRPNVTIVQSRKTAAPMILAIIAFVLWLPSLLCNAVCASVIADTTGGSGASGLLLLPSIVSVLVFILCFFCKSKHSAKTGVLIILLAVVMMICHLFLFNPFALVSAVLYIIAGAYSVANAKRPA